MLAGDLKLPTFLGDLLKKARVLQCDGRLIGEALHQADYGWRELARLAPPQDQGAERLVRRQQGDEERCTKPCLEYSIAQGIAGALHKVGNLQRPLPGNRLSRAGLFRGNV